MEKVTVSCGSRAYDIVIESGSLSCVGAFVRKCCGPKGRKAGIVTTERVAPLYLELVCESLSREGYDIIRVVLPDGEEFKTLALYEEVVTRLIEAKFERQSVIVPLGGGVVGDLAGFAAATLLRGVPFVQVPTTIVAQIDSSIGGKVAVDHPLGKNLIGSFYQPWGVFIDPRVLRTLEKREVVCGMAEAVKHAVIRDELFFGFLERELERIMAFDAPDVTMERFITWNCGIKAAVVAADERETGLRAILNYGHTVGHALETVTRYQRFKHGEAVLLGMVAAGRIAEMKGLFLPDDRRRHDALIERVGLNRDLRGIEPDDVIKAMARDKKVSGGRIRFILPRAIGAVEIRDDVTHEEIHEGLASLFNS